MLKLLLQLKLSINKYSLNKWRTSCNNSIGTKLLEIQPTLNETSENKKIPYRPYKTHIQTYY